MTTSTTSLVGGDARVRASATPETWITFGNGWHLYVQTQRGEALNLCGLSADVAEIKAISDAEHAPEDERCTTCEERRINRRFVERGLRELVANTEDM